MKAFAAETRRLADNYYVTVFLVSNRSALLSHPLFHWLSRPVRARLLHRLPIAHAGTIRDPEMVYQVVDDARLMDLHQFSLLFPDSHVSFERFLGVPKSMVAVCPAS